MATIQKICLNVSAALIALAIGCGGGGNLSQEDMARFAIRRPKNDETSNPSLQQQTRPPNNPSDTAKTNEPQTVVSVKATAPHAAPLQSPTALTTSSTTSSANNANAASVATELESGSGTTEGSSDTVIPPSAPLDAVERRRRTLSNITKLSTALESYREKHGRYPLHAIFSHSGQPLLSWRIELLPYLGYQTLYDKFNKSEPWNSVNNQPLLKQIPSVYQSPERYDTKTNYLLSVGTSAAFFGKRAKVPRRWEDGLTNVAVLLEVDNTHAVPWSAPMDHNVDLRNPKVGLGNLREDGFFLAWGGGQVARIANTTAGSDIKAMFTVDGGEPFTSGTISLAATAEFDGGAPLGQTDSLAKSPSSGSATRPIHAMSRSPITNVTAPENSIDDFISESRFAIASHQESEGVQLAYLSILSDRLSAVDSYRWVSGLRRPAAFVRYGIAIDFHGPNHEQLAQLIDSGKGWSAKRTIFFDVVGELGESLIERLKRSELFGPEAIVADLPEIDHRQSRIANSMISPGVEFLGAGSPDIVARAANVQNVDVLFLITVQDRRISRGNSINKHVSLQCIDVANRRSLFQSSTISYARRENKRTTDLLYQDPVESALLAVEKLIAEKLTPTPIPSELRSKHAEARVNRLARSGRLNKLRSASEVKLYHQLGLIPIDRTLEAYNNIIGKEAGLTLLAGDIEERKVILTRYKPQVEWPNPNRHRKANDDDE